MKNKGIKWQGILVIVAILLLFKEKILAALGVSPCPVVETSPEKEVTSIVDPISTIQPKTYNVELNERATDVNLIEDTVTEPVYISPDKSTVEYSEPILLKDPDAISKDSYLQIGGSGSFVDSDPFLSEDTYERHAVDLIMY